MKKVLTAMVVLPLVLAAGGCASIEGRVYGECDNSGSCKAGGEIKGRVEFKTMSQPSLLQTMLASSATFDAAAFRLDVSNSTVAVPSTGTVVIQLVNSGDGSVQAAKRFTWAKAGSNLVLQNPDAVNSWALTDGGTADSLKYNLDAFVVGQSAGHNSLSIASQYEGQTIAATTTSWNAGHGCRWVRCQVH